MTLPPTDPRLPQPPQPQWTPPAPPPVQWQETEPLEYHQLLRGVPRYRWWKPLLALVLATVYYIVFSVVIAVAVVVPYLFSLSTSDPDEMFAAVESLIILDTQNPWSILLGLGSVALMIPAVWLAMLSVGLSPFGRAWSVALRIRWRWIWRTVLPAVAALVVMTLLSWAFDGLASLIDPSRGAASEPPALQFDMTLALWSLGIALVLVPVQAAAEELVFRGMFMQVLGAWLGGVRGAGVVARFMQGPWIVILLPSIVFGFAHIYDVWGWLSVVFMALTAAWLVWRTGGLEAAITLHVVNNLVALAFMSFAVDGETKQVAETGGSIDQLFAQLIGFAFFAWWVDRDFRRNDGRRTRIDVVEVRIAQPVPLSAPADLPQPTMVQPPTPQDPTPQPPAQPGSPT